MYQKHVPQLGYNHEGLGNWRMSFQFHDLSFTVEYGCDFLRDDHGDFKVLMWDMGDKFHFETKAEREIRHDLVRQHEQDITDEEIAKHDEEHYAYLPGLEESIMRKVEECHSRLIAINYIVNL